MVIKKANKKHTVETVADLIKPSKKYLYKCNCVYCNGKKVDSRTQEKHTKSKSLWKCEISRKNQENSIKAKRKKKSITSNVNPTKPNLPKKRKMISPSTPPNPPDSPNNDEVFEMESLDDVIDSEIIVWVFKFQQRFKLSDTALEVLIKFLRIILTRFNKRQFEEFPTSLYKAKKLLKIFQLKMQLAVCTDCHKLCNATNITTYKEDGKVAIMK